MAFPSAAMLNNMLKPQRLFVLECVSRRSIPIICSDWQDIRTTYKLNDLNISKSHIILNANDLDPSPKLSKSFSCDESLREIP